MIKVSPQAQKWHVRGSRTFGAVWKVAAFAEGGFRGLGEPLISLSLSLYIYIYIHTCMCLHVYDMCIHVHNYNYKYTYSPYDVSSFRHHVDILSELHK